MHEGELRLASRERKELRDRVRSRTLPAEDVRRARLMLLLAQGKSYLLIRQVLGCNPNYISRWKGRFEAERLAGLYSRHRGRAVEKRTPALEARILEWTRTHAPDGGTHWSSRKLARHLGISRGAIPRGSPQSPSPLHPDLLLLAQSGRKLVRQDRARCHRPRCLHLGQGLGPQAHALHPPLQSRSHAHQVDLPRPLTAHQP